MKRIIVSEQVLDLVQHSLEDTYLLAAKTVKAKEATLQNTESSIVLDNMKSTLNDAKVSIGIIKTLKKG